MEEPAESSQFQEIVWLVGALGVAAVVEDGVVVVLQRRTRPLADGFRHAEFCPRWVHSLADLNAALSDAERDGDLEIGAADSELAQDAASPVPVELRAKATARVMPIGAAFPARLENMARGLLPAFSLRSAAGFVAAFLFVAAAWQDSLADKPHAPFGTLSVAVFALWQAYRRPAVDDSLANGRASLLSALAAVCLLSMAMMVGHAFDGLLFHIRIQPEKAIVAFLASLVIFVLLRENLQKIVSEGSTGSGPRPAAMSWGGREAAIAMCCLVWVAGSAYLSTAPADKLADKVESKAEISSTPASSELVPEVAPQAAPGIAPEVASDHSRG